MSSLTRLIAATVLLLAGAASAQTYPSKPIRLVVPFPAGGATLLIATPSTHSIARAN